MRAETEQLDRADLDRRSAELAAALGRRRIGAEDIVGLVMRRSADLVVAMIGVLRAGAAFVVVPPDEPARHREELLERCGVRTVLPGLAVSDRPAPPGPRPVDGSALAYICFTSGSTGRPKGVMISRDALANYIEFACRHYGLDDLAGQTSLLHTSPAFDLFLTSVLPPLVSGMVVEVMPGEGSRSLAARTAAAGVGLLKVTPSHLRGLVALGAPAPRAAVVVVGGEQFTGADVDYLRGGGGAPKVFNEYGPTEATVGCMVHDCDDRPLAGAVPIGRSISGMRERTLSREMLPLGGAGDGRDTELFLGGTGLARGYLGAPAATAERFLPDPDGPPGARLYRSGDLVSVSPRGELRFAGRVDEQLKVLGHRIEPQEVRERLLRHPGCRDAVVDAPTGDALRAVVVLARGATPEQLRDHIAETAPAHLVPAQVVAVPEIPLTANGKVDRAALDRMMTTSATPDSAGAEGADLDGEDPLRRDVASLFCDLLGRAEVDTTSSFFDLGGSSIAAIQLLARVEATFGAPVPPSRLHDDDPETGLPLISVDGLCGLIRAEPSVHRAGFVQLREGAGNGTAVLVHGAGGDFGGYRQLAELAPAGTRVIALQALRTHAVDQRDMAAIARFHASGLAASRPETPLRLIGWSFGGLLALEIARVLGELGLAVADLVVVDSFVPDGDETSSVAEAAADAAAEGVALLGLGENDPLPTHLRHAVDLYEDHLWALRGHRPSTVDIPVTVVHADAHGDEEIKRNEAAWADLAPGRTAFLTVGGDHHSVLHNRELADAVTRAWERNDD
ncbi:AMP-binding protein [Actinokineospora guangxiensis]|uniref:AMP-binding protein n=1 Tax=Actinokineospora guangxiensis TaxID=1490288 RepID=A0ABW0EUG5_9PSEU